MRRRTTAPRDSVTDAIGAAETLVADGRAIDAIRLLTETNRRSHDARLEKQLVRLRSTAFASLDSKSDEFPPAVTSAGPGCDGALPEIEARDLSVAVLRQGLAEQGCVLVRGLIARERAKVLAEGIDRVLDEFDAGVDPGTGAPSRSSSSWYVPFEPPDGRYRVGGRRKWVRASGAVWTIESPRLLFELCELLEDTGVGRLVTEYLGERPALSANKCTLRRVPVDTDTNWHQDGAFLGPEVRSINLWLALSDCGPDSPGLEIVPRRFDSVLPTGTEGAMFDWSVSPALVAEVSQTSPAVSPSFRAGDALLFDHLLLHRTAVRPGMTRERYAMENWLFAPSSYPEGQIPVVF